MNSNIASYFLEFEIVQTIVAFLSTTFLSTKLGLDSKGIMAFVIYFIGAFVLVNIAAIIGGLGTYAERKISADIQMRMGPNRVGPYGLLQFLADGVKLFMKEDVVPAKADKKLFFLAPLLCMVGIMATLAVLPISSKLALTNLNIGVFYLIAISSLIGLGVFIAGYSSNSKWSMLGGMRGASQIISYEIPVTISILSIALLSGGLSFEDIVGKSQTGLPHGWYLFHNPFTFIGFFIFFIGSLAEANRAPFDLPEAESELVSGFHTEYSGMKFAFFGLAEFAEVFVLMGVAASLFLGGYKVPFDIGGETLVGQILQVLVFFTKAFALYYVVIWIRWTLPRLRVDQLMTICWKYLTPISMFNLVGCAVWMYAFNGRSLWQIIMH
jgi:NADH-quinone oxidoreductase subunit H